MLIGIPNSTNKIGLSALLVNLQTQTTKDDIIYIMDNSIDGSGHQIARLYGGSKTITLVERGSFSIYESWNIFIDSMIENSEEGVLILNDDVLLSNTCIPNLKRAHNLSEHLCLTTKTPKRGWASERLDPNFQWFNRVTRKEDILDSEWLVGFAFYLKRECIKRYGKFDEHYRIWFGDTEYENRIKSHIGIITNEYIYHFGNRSFKYKDEAVQKQIQLDRIYYDKSTK